MGDKKNTGTGGRSTTGQKGMSDEKSEMQNARLLRSARNDTALGGVDHASADAADNNKPPLCHPGLDPGSREFLKDDNTASDSTTSPGSPIKSGMTKEKKICNRRGRSAEEAKGMTEEKQGLGNGDIQLPIGDCESELGNCDPAEAEDLSYTVLYKIQKVLDPIWLYYQQQMAKPYIPTSLQEDSQLLGHNDDLAPGEDNYAPGATGQREGRSRAQKMLDAFPYLTYAQAGFLGLVMDIVDVLAYPDDVMEDLLKSYPQKM